MSTRDLRKAVRRLVIYLLWISGITRWARARLRKENAVIVLMLHRVLSVTEQAATNSEAAMIIGDRTYEGMIAYLRRHYRFVDVCDPRVPFAGDRLGIALTFDDGWADNFAPLMRHRRESNVPATVFISPALAEKIGPFWPERIRQILGKQADETELHRVVESLKLLSPAERHARIEQLARTKGVPGDDGGVDRTMSWQQLDELHSAGIGLQSHTMDHEILTSLNDSELIDHELLAGKKQMAGRWGSCDILAYPNGGHDDRVVERTRQAGYLRAFTVKPGIWTPDTDPLRIPRLNITDGRVAFDGEFSPAAFEFSVVLRAFRAWRAERRSAESLPERTHMKVSTQQVGD